MRVLTPVSHHTSTATLRLVMDRLTEQLCALVERGHFKGSLTINIGPRGPCSVELRAVTGEDEDWDLGLG